ncbi:ShlB/FhaC/HecB family hemolysin secretion/activation protein [Pigmentiphaga sp. YJ18]|uniref:ShlB/FhaC/HecB family hemolysin secretion/activation protein n=1 Tax=unclassified Pigmentiphaga TaxID=2626614 RepID=UPI0013755005|nr:ShlB/FhaC/HecB family hemolysin secretion/activation protein [Pigmentiphaga sp. H8]
MSPRSSLSHAWLAALLGLPALHAGAQTPPDAGSLLREMERNLRAPSGSSAPQAVPAARPMPEDAKSTRITVRRIVLEGASLVPESELQALVAPLAGQSLTFAQLEHAAQRIAEDYRRRGWYARVYLPQQDVTDGTVRIRVLEGRYGGANVDAGERRANAASVQSTVTHRLRPGRPLSAADLERGLLLANDLPGVHAEGVLQPGDDQGETRLALAVQDTAFVTGDAGVNNYGLKSTGVPQAVGGVALNNLTGGGDQLALRLLAARDIHSAVARYSLPLGHDGLRLSLQASTLDYELGGDYRSLEAKGKAHTGGFTFSYPLIRQVDRNLTLSAGYEHRRYDDDMLGEALHRQRVNAITLGLGGDVRDGLGGGAVNWGAAQLTQGNLNLDGVAGDAAQDAVSARSSGRYTKLAWNMTRLQNLGAGWQVQLSFSGQLASGNLASSERMTLGGPSQVRAYPVNEASGDQGMLLKLELQRELGYGWQAVAFYDTGRIQQHKSAWDGWNASSGQPNRYSLSGAGLGLNWRARQWVMSASVAVPVGHNRGASANGRNSDGSRASSARGWVSLAWLF